MIKELAYFLSEYNQHLAIVANGQFPTDEQIIASILESKIIIAADGGIHNLAQYQIIADYVVGDADSINEASCNNIRNPYVYFSDQDANDLTKAFNFALHHFPELPVIIYAASGLREDHSIANFALLAKFTHKQPLTTILSDYGIFTVCKSGISELRTIRGQQVSFFALDNEAKATCAELKWPLNEFKFAALYSGTLNQATKELIRINCSGEIIVYRAFEYRK